jgi:hypothetical protein
MVWTHPGGQTMTTITLERAFMIRVLEQLDVAQSLLERSQHHAKIAAMYEELRAALAPPATAPEPSTEVAVGKLCKSLREDLDYAWTWHCNIAMAAFDAGCPHDVANEGAARFMQLLAGVDTREHPAFQGTQDHPMRNDKTAPAQPAWHDAPTCAGLWHVKTHPRSHPTVIAEVFVSDVNAVPTHCRWYGPIPEDRQ